jgi:hypothetical protein
MPVDVGGDMTDEHFSELSALLREAEVQPDEAFVADVQWLIDLDIAYARQRRALIRRWVVDLGSALSVALIGYVIAENAPNTMAALPSIVSLPLLAAAAVAAVWLSTRSPNLVG